MSEQKSHQPIDLSNARKPSEYLEREAQKQNESDTVESQRELIDESKPENELAHEQNITAHIPGGSTIADVDK